MKPRKCDTAKYRRRMKKQRENRAIRLQTATLEEQEAMINQAYQERPLEALTTKAALAEIERSATVVEAAQESKKSTRPVCPLCNREITLEESQEKNVTAVQLNKKWVTVHRTCPTEVEK